VATRFLGDIEMEDDIRRGCIEMCQEFHTTTLLLSERFLAELERHNYVTPTSYLEMINTFKLLLDNKRSHVIKVTQTTDDSSMHRTPDNNNNNSKTYKAPQNILR